MSKKPDLAALFGATEADTFMGLEACKNYDKIMHLLRILERRVLRLTVQLEPTLEMGLSRFVKPLAL